MSIIGLVRKPEGSFLLSLQYEISVLWAAVVRKGPIGPVIQADFGNMSALRGAAFSNAVLELHAGDWCVSA